MRINNQTDWDTAHMRRVFSRVLTRWNKDNSGTNRVVRSKGLRVKVMHCRARSGNGSFSGCAWIGGRSMTLRLPNPRPRTSYGMKVKAWDGELSVRRLAYIFEHELAHCAGFYHRNMGSLRHWKAASSSRYDFIDDLKVDRAEPKAKKPKPDQQVIRYRRAQAALRRWETKAKRANTAIRKYRASVKRYERVLTENGKLEAAP